MHDHRMYDVRRSGVGWISSVFLFGKALRHITLGVFLGHDGLSGVRYMPKSTDFLNPVRWHRKLFI